MPPGAVWSWPLLGAVLLLSACASGGGAPTGGGGAYVGGAVGLECAPFARALTGVRLGGAAASWWTQAQGRYARSATPADGSVLVLRQEPRLPYGHVAVVSRVVSSREILVTQANWVHHRVTQDQPVVDVSADNDWTLVQVWWPPAGQLGTHDYPAYGFIRPDRAQSHDAIAAATPAAIRMAGGG
jgi:surface antigen